MTNSTTPLPVQEPAGAVEAIMALADAYAEAAQRGEDAMSIARKCAALRSALASLQPVTQAKPDVSIPGLGMNASGERVDSANVTQAKSEAVAWQYRADREQSWCHCSLGVIEKYQRLGYEVRALVPQEAVERQPLTDVERAAFAWIFSLNESGWYGSRFGPAVDYLQRHGIGPATQEKQHG